MNDTPSKLFALLCLLGAVWTGVYWLWEPRGPRTTLDPRKPDPGLTVDDPTGGSAQPPPTVIRQDSKKSEAEEAARRAAAAKPKPPEPATTPRGPRGNGASVVPPEFTEYVVRRGDTFESIARRQYGDANLRGAILRANPLTSDDLLKPGMTILIPKDPGNIQGKLVQPTPEQPKPAPTTPADPSASPASPASLAGGKTYRIQSDDTLWGISKKFYGKGAMYKLIADANKDKIPNPDDTLPVGVEIVIPDAPNAPR